MTDSYDLTRFVRAQDAGDTYLHALAELRRGRKTSHWMWFVFPQIAGLGRSSMAQQYALGSLDEARAYAEHPVLGPRLLDCVRALLELPSTTPEAVFGGVDAMKLRSSMTLFTRAVPTQQAFSEVLDRYFGGEADPATLSRI